MKNLGGNNLKPFIIARERFGSTAAMARELGISDSMLSRILKGKVNSISDELWNKAKTLFEPYCPFGYAHCFMEHDGEEFKELVANLTTVDDAAYLRRLNKQVLKWKEKHQAGIEV